MSTTQHQVMMESSLALGRLELTPGSAAVGVNLTPRLPGAPLAKEKSGQRPLGPQGQAILNGCVPLSHQVAGHKYGVDKVGKSTGQEIFSFFLFFPCKQNFSSTQNVIKSWKV